MLEEAKLAFGTDFQGTMGIRILYLVRHGQYFSAEGDPKFGHLTGLGRRQAKRTGKRLAQLDFDAIFHSDLPRAVETKELIATQMGPLPIHSVQALRELMPPVPKRPGFAKRTSADIADLRAATPILVKRFLSAPRGKRTRCELIVTHGNLIRYLVRMALEEPVERWAYFATHHCGVTVIVIRQKPSSNYLVSYNDVGHLPNPMQTMM